MRYALLIYESEEAWAQRSPEEIQAILGEYYAFGDSIKDRMRGGEALLPTVTGKTVSVRDGERLVTDGPFAETKEQLGGLYIVDTDTEEDALEAAARIPSARWGHVVVRACQVFPDQPEHRA